MNINGISKLEICSNYLKRIGKRSLLEVKPNQQNITPINLKLSPTNGDILELSKSTEKSPQIIDRLSGKIIPTEVNTINKDNKIYFNLKTKDGEL